MSDVMHHVHNVPAAMNQSLDAMSSAQDTMFHKADLMYLVVPVFIKCLMDRVDASDQVACGKKKRHLRNGPSGYFEGSFALLPFILQANCKDGLVVVIVRVRAVETRRRNRGAGRGYMKLNRFFKSQGIDNSPCYLGVCILFNPTFNSTLESGILL